MRIANQFRKYVRNLGIERCEDRRLLAGDLEMVSDLNAVELSFGAQEIFVSSQDKIYFTSQRTNDYNNVDLWIYDEASMESRPVTDGLSAPMLIGETSEFMFFTEGPSPSSIWRTDGTPGGTVEIATDLGYLYTPPTGFEVAGRFVFHVASGGIWTSDGTTEGTYELGQGSNLHQISNSQLVFLGYDDEHGTELWTTDGTPGGTSLLKDIYAGNGSSNFGTDFVELDGWHYFKAYSEEYGTELWRTDGTESGTELFADIAPGPDESFPQLLTRAGDRLFFTADDFTHGQELWSTDGTIDGTEMVRDINESDGSYPYSLTAFGDKVGFNAWDGTTAELWVSDGTEAGTFALTDYEPYIDDMFAVGDKLVYRNYYAETYYVTDGTVANTNPFFTGWIQDHAAIGDAIVFLSYSDELGTEPHISDLTVTGTHLLDDIWTGPNSSIENTYESLKSAGDKVYFSASFGIEQSALFSTDGTPEGTTIVSEGIAYTDDSGIEIKGSIGNKLIYSGNEFNNAAPSDSLWAVENGVTTRIHGENNRYYGPLAEWNGEYYFLSFLADDTGSYREVYKTDGTAEGTEFLFDVADIGITRYYLELRAIESGLLFLALRDDVGYEYWVTDGTTGGTSPVTDVVPGSGGGSFWFPMASTDDDEYAYFFANDFVHGFEVWRANGNLGDARMLGDVGGPNAPYDADSLRRVGDNVFFATNDGSNTNPWGIYAWNETSEELTRVFYATHQPTILDGYDDELRFLSGDGHIWESDGTFEGTDILMANPPGRAYHGSFDGKMLLGDYSSGDNSQDLWISDGTSEGTELLVADLVGGIFTGAALDGRFYFGANDGEHGDELWSTDGTAIGTRLETDAWNGDRSSAPRWFSVAGGTLYVKADTEKFGNELFYLDTSDLVVSNLEDYGPDDTAIDGSLRRMMEKAVAREGADEITFEDELAGTIPLQSQLEVESEESVSITGVGTKAISISGEGASRVFYVHGGELSLENLKVVDGFATDAPDVPSEIEGLPVDVPDPGVFALGGGIFNNGGSVHINSVTFDGNETGGFTTPDNPFGRAYVGLGGAIGNFFGGEVSVRGSRFVSNRAIGSGLAAGGAIETDAFSSSFVEGTTFISNRAQALLGGIEQITDPTSPLSFQGVAVGGAMKASGGSTQIVRNSVFLGNQSIAGNGTPGLAPHGGFAAGGGGLGTQALSLFVGVVPGVSTQSEVYDSFFTSNQAVGGDAVQGAEGGYAAGGAISNWGASDLYVTRTRFSGNAALGGDGGDGVEANVNGGNGGKAVGGAIDTGFSSFGQPTTVIRSSALRNNRATGGNGGTAFEGGIDANGGAALGGALANSTDYLIERLGLEPLATGTLEVQFSNIQRNRALGGSGETGGDALGGGIGNQASVSISYAPITRNSATGGTGDSFDGEGLGGGIYNDEALAAMIDLDFISNRLLRRNLASTDGNDKFGL